MSLKDLQNDVATTIFYVEDFNSIGAYDYWTEEFNKASSLPTQQFINWANIMLGYLDDFSDSSSYIRDEIEGLLTDIISCDVD